MGWILILAGNKHNLSFVFPIHMRLTTRNGYGKCQNAKRVMSLTKSDPPPRPFTLMRRAMHDDGNILARYMVSAYAATRRAKPPTSRCNWRQTDKRTHNTHHDDGMNDLRKKRKRTHRRRRQCRHIPFRTWKSSKSTCTGKSEKLKKKRTVKPMHKQQTKPKTRERGKTTKRRTEHSSRSTHSWHKWMFANF